MLRTALIVMSLSITGLTLIILAYIIAKLCSYKNTNNNSRRSRNKQSSSTHNSISLPSIQYISKPYYCNVPPSPFLNQGHEYEIPLSCYDKSQTSQTTFTPTPMLPLSPPPQTPVSKKEISKVTKNQPIKPPTPYIFSIEDMSPHEFLSYLV